MAACMTAKERLLATLQGKPCDRVPIYTQIPFALRDSSFIPGPFHGYADYDDWRERDPAYQKLVRRMQLECDNFFIWRPQCMKNSQFFVPPATTVLREYHGADGKVYREYTSKVGDAEFREVQAVQIGSGHSWEIEPLCKTTDDALRLLDVDWEGYPAQADDFFALEEQLGDRGLMWVTIPSPIQSVCRLFDPSEFLILCRIDEVLIQRLMEVCAKRIYRNLEALLEQGVGPIIRFGGAEHATPPLMSNADFDWLVVQYDTPLVDLCKRYGKMVAYHCHGNITHALQRFVQMGVDMTDPVETTPDGNLSLREARNLASDKLTLIGNVQIRDIAQAKPAEIREKVRTIIEEGGPSHLIVTTTGTPLEKMDKTTENNYHALIDAVLEFGGRM